MSYDAGDQINNSAERQLFDWTEVDEVDAGILVFYGCKLRVPLGKWPIGTTFDTVTIDYQRSLIIPWQEDGNTKVGSWQLLLSIGPEVEVKDDQGA